MLIAQATLVLFVVVFSYKLIFFAISSEFYINMSYFSIGLTAI